MRLVLCADIDHVRQSAGIEVRETGAGLCGILVFLGAHG
jgi:hypothetical protein